MLEDGDKVFLLLNVLPKKFENLKDVFLFEKKHVTILEEV